MAGKSSPIATNNKKLTPASTIIITVGQSTVKATNPIINKGAVSPRTFVMPMIVPVKIPESESGTRLWKITCCLGAPKLREAS